MTQRNDPIGTDFLVARGLMNDTRRVPYAQSIGRVQRSNHGDEAQRPADGLRFPHSGHYRDTRPTAPRGIPLGPVTKAIEFGNKIPVRTVHVVNWPWLVITFALGLVFGLGAGILL